MAASLYWEDFTPGQEFVTPTRTVAEKDLRVFSEVSGDRFPLHIDQEFASKSRFGKCIAQGALVFSLSIGMMTSRLVLDDSLIALYGVDRLRFTTPVFPGDTLTMTKKVLKCAPVTRDSGMVSFESTVRNERGEVVLVYMNQLLLRRRGAGEEARNEQERTAGEAR